MDKIIDKLSIVLRQGLKNPSEDNIAIMNYGLTVLLYNLPKTILLFFLAFILGYGMEMLTAFLVFGLIRNFSHGIHAKTPLGCFIWGMTTYISMLLSSTYVTMNNKVYAVLYAVAFVFYLIFAPSGTEARPVGKQQYKIHKAISLIIIIVYAVTGLYVNPFLRNIMLFSVWFQMFNILPITYKISGQKGGVIIENKT